MHAWFLRRPVRSFRSRGQKPRCIFRNRTDQRLVNACAVGTSFGDHRIAQGRRAFLAVFDRVDDGHGADEGLARRKLTDDTDADLPMSARDISPHFGGEDRKGRNAALLQLGARRPGALQGGGLGVQRRFFGQRTGHPEGQHQRSGFDSMPGRTRLKVGHCVSHDARTVPRNRDSPIPVACQ